ncbi:unnamed protein product [Parnassius apollo]|uniref:(apollo) hypothetical protein n=1 Tax=Parnassius apollo TaxID=110799 RepID=A0A8S3WY28_PARAO|nr:unnamed protein product [Parnassius apollo]
MEPLQADSVPEATAPDDCGAQVAAEPYWSRNGALNSTYRYVTDWRSGVFARLIRATGTNRFPAREILSTIMVDIAPRVRSPISYLKIS